MTRLSVIENTRVQEDWRLLRLRPHERIPPLHPGQWLRARAGGRPCVLPVHRHHEREGWIAVLLPPAAWCEALAPDDALSLEAVEGHPVDADNNEGNLIILGGDAGIGPAMALATRSPRPRVALFDANLGLPARIVPSRFMIPGIPPEAMAGLKPLEEAGVASRIAVPDGRPGCFEGNAVEMLRHYASTLSEETRQGITLVTLMPWRRLARWHDDLTRVFRRVDLIEFPG